MLRAGINWRELKWGPIKSIHDSFYSFSNSFSTSRSAQSQFDEHKEEVNQYYYNHEQFEDLDHPLTFAPIMASVAS